MYYLFLVTFIVLMIYAFYLQVSTLRWDQGDIRRLEAIELHLAHILRLLDAPDVRYLMKNSRKARRSLFLDFSECLYKDVLVLFKTRALKMSSVAFLVLFLVAYFVTRVKARLRCTHKDLRFLSGLELVLVRSLD